MGNSWVKDAAFLKKELLEKDVVFKQKFYYTQSAHYETATLAEIQLIPADYIIEALRDDYKAMQDMIYGEYPVFEDIIKYLEKLQIEIHSLDNQSK